MELTESRTDTQENESTKLVWTTPQVEELSIEEIVDLAEIKIAFANTNSSSDQG